MKTKFFTLFAAMLLLFGAKAMAQTDGDVNGDGKVDEQDITAIIQIMQEAGGVKEQTKYYWYAGWTEPTAANIATIINETNDLHANKMDHFGDTPAGKYIGTTLGTYTISNPLAVVDYFDTNYTHFEDKFYIVIPEGIEVYDSEGEATLEDIFDSTDIKIPGHRVLISKDPNNVISCYLLR